MTATPTPTDLDAATAILQRGGDPRRALCLAMVRLLQADTATLWQARDGMLELTATSGELPAIAPRLPLGRGSAAGRAAADGMRFYIADAPNDPDAHALITSQLSLQTLLAEPVLTPDGVAGAIVLGWQRPVGPPGPLASALIPLVVAQASTAIEQGDEAAALTRQALTDPLTGLLNRRGLARELEREMARAARRGTPLAFALMDLDEFKAYNDEHGHVGGDRLLRRAAETWRAQLRTQDTLARFGGEEFVLLLPDTGPEAAIAVVERVRRATPDGETASVGVAIWDGREPVHRLAERADAALYAAKQDGRDRALAA